MEHNGASHKLAQSTAASVTAFCYKAMLHVLNEIFHDYPQASQRVSFQVLNFFKNIYIYTLVEYVKPKQECVCTFPRFQDLHRTPWVNLGRPETQEVKS